MACILLLPSMTSKGVVTFTTVEWVFIKKSQLLLNLLIELKSDYFIGLHFNWHDHKFTPDRIWDFHMAGEGDLISINNDKFYQIKMDACNFTPKSYHKSDSEKFWDVLCIGNPVYFKRPEVVLTTIRELFNISTVKLKVLYISPIPIYKFRDECNVLYDLRDYYDALFTEEEKTRFTLLTTNFNSPNPFDRNTLSVFLKIAKYFCTVQ